MLLAGLAGLVAVSDLVAGLVGLAVFGLFVTLLFFCYAEACGCGGCEYGCDTIAQSGRR